MKSILISAVLVISMFPLTVFSQWSQTGSNITHNYINDSLFTTLNSTGNFLAVGFPKMSYFPYYQAGQVRVYKKVNNNWFQYGSDIDGTSINGHAGTSLDISDDGNTLTVGIPLSPANGYLSGEVKVYSFDGTSWGIKGDSIVGLGDGDYFGHSVSISSNGNRIAIGAPEPSINGKGYALVFEYDGSSWIPLGNRINGDNNNDNTGYSVDLSSDGNRLVVGSPENNYNGINSGAVKIYEYNGSSWIQIGGDINGLSAGNNFGKSVAISRDGNFIIGGAPSSSQFNSEEGQVRVFYYDTGSWVPQGNPILGDSISNLFGTDVEISKSGQRIIIGAPGEYSWGSSYYGGFVEVYDFLNNNWQRVGQKLKGNVNNTSMFGLSVDISSDGKTIATSSTHSGIVQVYETSINVNTTQKGNLKKVELFPIPIFNYVNIRGDFLKEKAIIYSIDGRKLYEFKINEISNFKLDLSFLSRGIYMMEIYDDKGNKYIQKMIK